MLSLNLFERTVINISPTFLLLHEFTCILLEYDKINLAMNMSQFLYYFLSRDLSLALVYFFIEHIGYFSYLCINKV